MGRDSTAFEESICQTTLAIDQYSRTSWVNGGIGRACSKESREILCCTSWLAFSIRFEHQFTATNNHVQGHAKQIIPVWPSGTRTLFRAGLNEQSIMTHFTSPAVKIGRVKGVYRSLLISDLPFSMTPCLWMHLHSTSLTPQETIRWPQFVLDFRAVAGSMSMYRA